MRPLKRILVVDDEEKIRQILKEWLELNKYEVLTAANGLEAVGLVNVQPVDLVLLDVVMPEMDGWQVLRRLKSQEATRSIPVIMLTAKGDAAALLSAQSLGATDHVIKPFQADELLTVIRRSM